MITETQKLARNAGIGSSDIPAIFGLSPWTTARDVWMQKRGLLAEQEENEAMELGNRFEPAILDWAKDQLAFTRFVKDVSLIGPEPWMIANLDARGVLPEERYCVVEAKTAGLKGYSDSLDEWGEEGTDQIPQQYILQCHWQMFVAGSHFCTAYVPVLINQGGLEFRLYVVQRDEEMVTEVVEGARDFWRMVENGIEPEGTISPNVAKRVKRIPNVAPVEVPVDLFADYQQAAANFKQAEEAKDAAYGRLIGALGVAEWGICKLGKVTFKTQERKGFDSKAFVADNPALAKNYEKVTTFRTLRVSAAK